MTSAVDAWKQNLTTKVEELRTLLLRFLTTKEDKTADEIAGRLTGLKMMFADDQVPQPLRNLESALSQFRPHRHHPEYFLQVMRGYDALPTVATFSEAEPPSFDQIFESYKTDGELESLVSELVAVLQRILSEADDLLSAHIARELQVILEQLKNRNRRSLYELQSWVDLGVRALLMVTETYTGTHGLNLVYEAAKIAFRIKRRLLTHYIDAQKRLVDEHKLTYVQKAMVQIPEITSEEQVQKFLNEPPKESA